MYVKVTIIAWDIVRSCTITLISLHKVCKCCLKDNSDKKMVRGMRKLPSRVPVFIIVKRRRRGFQMIAMWIGTRKKLRLMMDFRPESRVYIHERDVLKSTLEYRLKIDWLLVLRGNGGKRVISAAPGCLVVRNFRAACSGRVNEGIHVYTPQNPARAAICSESKHHLVKMSTHTVYDGGTPESAILLLEHGLRGLKGKRPRKTRPCL